MVQVAFATTDMQRVDQHFGVAQRYAIYRVTAQGSALLCAAQFAQEQGVGGEGTLTGRIALLEGCTLVYCEAVGGGAIRRLLGRGIRPVRVPTATPIATLLSDLQRGLSARTEDAAEGRSGIASSDDEARFAAMEAEGWVE